MKKIIILAFTIALSVSLKAQINVPAPSPNASFSQKFGLTEIKWNTAKKFDNSDYIRMNEESIAEWKKVK